MNQTSKVKEAEIVEPGKGLSTDTSPAAMIQMAMEKGQNLDNLERFLTLQEKWEAKEARKAYHVAMTAFKLEAPMVTKDKLNKQYNSKYTSLSNLVNTVNPILSKHGLSASWDHEQNGTIKVTCKITHVLGHSEETSATAPVDKSGAKNEIQQIKSTITYLKAVTFESICGLASTDANLDDDGAGVVEYITSAQIKQIKDRAFNLKVDNALFLDYMGVESVEKLLKSDFQKAMLALNAKKEKNANY